MLQACPVGFGCLLVDFGIVGQKELQWWDGASHGGAVWQRGVIRVE